MKTKWWHVPLGLWLAVVLVGVLAAGTASATAEAEAEDYDVEYCREVGYAHYERGEYEEALKWYDRGLALKPKSLELNLYKVGCLSKLGRFEEAEESYLRTIELRPDGLVMQFLRGYFLGRMDRPEEGLVSYDRALELYEDGCPSLQLSDAVAADECARMPAREDEEKADG